MSQHCKCNNDDNYFISEVCISKRKVPGLVKDGEARSFTD